jgi:hypothetical protein
MSHTIDEIIKHKTGLLKQVENGQHVESLLSVGMSYDTHEVDPLKGVGQISHQT